ncbi:orotidine 5'-phosphate decarboxylase [Neosynechococcus sphagnicola sy1]|uniref:Orotidine 5'-phosphate decarboxylase n=2 Tax=Neosynechococcus TaxID=1501143 RepID=A0A098TMU8_9CYAN|nr:orotidine 5'-phosphate decarboxylase [Neosynechococcus sphagnicola sy1]
MSVADRIIVPLDVPSTAQAIALMEQLPQVSFWKVGLELFVHSGGEILTLLKSRQKRVFLDLKFHDIPNTVAAACRSVAGWEVDLLTIHATVGKTGLKAAHTALQAQSPKTQLIAVTLLTSISARQLALELKVPLELPEYTLQMALLAQESGLSGVVCSPQEVATLRRVCGEDLLLVCPGVRPTWADAGDQKRTLTPVEAVTAGADYLVMGRPITATSDPGTAFERICEELTAIQS